MTGQFSLTDDQLAIREMAERFTADNITPHAAEWDEKHIFPINTIKQSRGAWLWRDLRVGRKRRDRAWAA